MGILIFKGFTARRLYTSFGVVGLKSSLVAALLILVQPGADRTC
jgi:hypothetical protein